MKTILQKANNLVKISIVVIFSGLQFNAEAQDFISIEKYKCSEIFALRTPIMVDSLDQNKKEYSDKDYLSGVALDFKRLRQSKIIMSADTAGKIALPYAEKDMGIQLLSFYIDALEYGKAKIEVNCTEMFELYVNSKRENIKVSKEDSLSRTTSVVLDLSLEPQRYEIVIKRLVQVKNFNQSELKVIIKADDKNFLTKLDVSLDNKRYITVNDVIEGKRLVDSSISPSGKYYFYASSEIAKGGKSYSSYSLKELHSQKVVYRFPSSIKPYWMPSSDNIYYWKQGLQNFDLCVFDVLTLEESKLFSQEKIASILVSPTEKFLAFQTKEELPAEKGNLKRHLSPSDRVGSWRSRNVLNIFNFDTQLVEKISFGITSTSISDISNDGEKLLLVTSKEDMSEIPFRKTAVYMLNMATNKIDTLANDAYLSQAKFSPDAQKVLFHAAAQAFGEIGQNILPNQTANAYDEQAFIMDLKTKKIRAITKEFDPSIASSYWSKYDNKIYFEVVDKDKKNVYVYDYKKDIFGLLDLKEELITNIRLAKTAPIALYRGQSCSNSQRLYSYDIKTHKSKLLEDPFANQLDELSLGKVQDWNFKTKDGNNIEGRYYLPANFDPQKKYPMIVYYYGGTTPTARSFESYYPLHVFAALGYVVYTLQPSGAIGFGQEFSARHVNAWGNPAAEEIIEGTKQFCKEHPFVNNEKIACIGASYGGFMSQYIITKTDIFAAAVSHAGISALSSYWGEGYWGYAYSSTASAGSYPWNNAKLYVEQSPLFNADKINTPLLLLHGSADTNVPIGESIQMYNALKILGKTVEFVQVEGENHGIASYQKRLDWSKTSYAWFAKWLKDDTSWWDALYPEKNW